MISMTAHESRDVALWNFRNLGTTFKWYFTWKNNAKY